MKDNIGMDKQDAINTCKELLKDGIYSRIYKFPYSQDYGIVILHDYNPNFIWINSRLYDYTFVDCVYYRWEGNNTPDYPIYCKKRSHRTIYHNEY